MEIVVVMTGIEEKPHPLDVGNYLGLEGSFTMERQHVGIPRKHLIYPTQPEGKCICCHKVLPSRRRKYCSDECSTKYFNDINPFFFITWNEFRDEILKRDNFNCVECGFNKEMNSGISKPIYGSMDFKIYLDLMDEYKKKIRNLHVHHKKELHTGGDEFNPDNCITLCTHCHREKHRNRKLEGTGIKQTKLV
jgi:5-methylcytosine-specific restriction endonuclease McrA